MSDAPLKILLIEADPRSLNFLSSLFTRQNYLVSTAPTGKEGYILALRDSPDVIILDTSIADIPALELVKKLRTDRRTIGTACLAFAPAADASKIGIFLAAGCNEFFVKDNESTSRLLGFLAHRQQNPVDLAQSPNKDRTQGFLAVFLGAKGGVGTSSLCANAAQNIALQNKDLDVAVLDLVLPVGSIDSIVGHKGEFGLLEATSLSETQLNAGYLRRVLAFLENWRFRFLPGSSDPEIAGSLNPAQLHSVTKTFLQVFDFTCVDLGNSISGAALPIIQQADVVVIVLGTDFASARLTSKVWQYLRRKGVNSRRVYMVLNRSVGMEGLSKSDAERILEMEVRATIPYMGGMFSLANDQHIPIKNKLPNDTAAMMIDQVSREILETARRSRA